MEIPAIPVWAQNIALHAVSGFLLGFSITFVANPGIDSFADLANAIWGASVIGLYGAIKEGIAYIETLLPKPVSTAAKPGEVPKAPVSIARKLL